MYFSQTARFTRRGAQILTWSADVEEKPVVLVLPNAYGLLRYAETLNGLLAEHGATVISLNARGQGEAAGCLSFNAASEDLCDAYHFARDLAKDKSAELYAIIHCSGLYAVLQAVRTGESFQDLKSIIVYSYLHDPARLFPTTRRKMRRLNIRFSDKIFEQIPGPARVGELAIPMSIVHPTTARSLQRASIEDVRRFARVVNANSVEFPKYGYNFSNKPQSEVIEKIVSKYYLPYLGI